MYSQTLAKFLELKKKFYYKGILLFEVVLFSGLKVCDISEHCKLLKIINSNTGVKKLLQLNESLVSALKLILAKTPSLCIGSFNCITFRV